MSTQTKHSADFGRKALDLSTKTCCCWIAGCRYRSFKHPVKETTKELSLLRQEAGVSCLSTWASSPHLKKQHLQNWPFFPVGAKLQHIQTDVVLHQRIHRFKSLIELNLFHVLSIVMHMSFAIVQTGKVFHLGERWVLWTDDFYGSESRWKWGHFLKQPRRWSFRKGLNEAFSSEFKKRSREIFVDSCVTVWLNIWCAAQVFPKCKTEYGRPRGATLHNPILKRKQRQNTASLEPSLQNLQGPFARVKVENSKESESFCGKASWKHLHWKARAWFFSAVEKCCLKWAWSHHLLSAHGFPNSNYSLTTLGTKKLQRSFKIWAFFSPRNG